MKSFRVIFLSLLWLSAWCSRAQVGYQVALVNTASGEPRALETVNVAIEITNSDGAMVYSQTSNATSNEFGILSLTVGNADTFSNVDWSKLPLFISATVDGVLLGKTQILSVPVAEHAKHVGELTKEILCSKTWVTIDTWFSDAYIFNIDGSFQKSSMLTDWDDSGVPHPYEEKVNGTYYIWGNIVALKYQFFDVEDDTYYRRSEIGIYDPHDNTFSINDWVCQ